MLAPRPCSTAAARTCVVLSAALALALLAGAAALFATGATPVNAQVTPADEPLCPGGGDPPTPTAVAVGAVPIVVASTTAHYFVLYVSHDLDGSTVEIPVLVKRGEAGSTTLAENVEALPAERYRVEKYLIASPADVDGDCIDDITELDSLGRMNPVNPAGTTELIDGAVAVPDRATFEALTFASLRFVLFGIDTGTPSVYFINNDTHPTHRDFLSALSIDVDQPGTSPGWVSEHGNPIAPDGSRGVYGFRFRPAPRFSQVDFVYTVLAASVPLFEDDLAYYLSEDRLADYEDGLALYEQSRIHLVFIDDVRSERNFIPLNEAEGYGLLRVMDLDERPNPRDVVIYEALPNTLPRVAGIITSVQQTPLSHVNLRAIQDGVPNAFIRDALGEPEIDVLIDRYVHYAVTEAGYTLRPATQEEVDNHYASSRPAQPQTPQRDLSIRAITPLGEIGFGDWRAFGVKAANVAVLGTLGFPEGTVPDGFAIPFAFYDEFMQHNDFYTRITEMLADPDFQTDFDEQEDQLKDLRKAIEKAETPQWIIDAIVEMNESFAEGVNRRYRSSTNNEDLPGFNGAGLYDSKSQKPSEDEDDLAKSLKEVYASLWNFRAFSERDFHRIDHLSAAMGILVHPSYQDELVNGVAVSFDPAYGSIGTYYLNSQVGEDLVTNPDALSVPEEVLLRPVGYTVVETSNQVRPGQLLMTEAHLDQLRAYLGDIHDHFWRLYNPAPGEPFAMEIEFKITSDDVLAIKQARPWVFSGSSPGGGGQSPVITRPAIVTRPTIVTPPTIIGGGGGGGPSGPSPSDEDFEWNITRDIEELASGHGTPLGMWSDGATLWLAENGDGADDAVYAYDLASGERVEDHEFELGERNRAPRGVWSDRATIWVADSGQNTLFAHDLETGERLPDSDIALASRNGGARGIWSDGSTMWVLDGGKDSLFGYDLASGELLAEYALDDANDDPHGLWSDRVTIWVSNHNPKRLFAYRLPVLPGGEEETTGRERLDLERVGDEEFTKLSSASNNSPRGLWSDGDVMYVADESDDRVYSYNMPDAIDARLASLTLSGVDIGEFSGGQPNYEGVPDEGVTETTVAAGASQSSASVSIEPADADEDAGGHQVAVEGGADITVTVTSADGSRTRVYRVSLGEAEPSPRCLRGAVAVGLSLVVFEGGSLEYLESCAQSRHVAAFYTLHEGEYFSYILGAPDFVRRPFRDLFVDGIPASTPLVIKSDGPPTADPAGYGLAGGDGVVPSWPHCLRGDVVTGLSLALYEGGSIDELDACAERRHVAALYTLHDGRFVPYILGAPEFVNRPFRDLYADGVPAAMPLIIRSDGPPAAGSGGDDSAVN